MNESRNWSEEEELDEIIDTTRAERDAARAELDALKAKVREYFAAREDYSQYYAESRMPQYRLEKQIAMEDAEAALRAAVAPAPREDGEAVKP